MFIYTPKKSILRDMQVPLTGRWWDKEYFKRMEILKTHGAEQSYTMNVVLEEYYEGTEFYSYTKRRTVPVHGYLFPVSMFDEVRVHIPD